MVVIDEAHHFRNPGVIDKTHYWRLYHLCEGKTVFFLTATPINNTLRDLQHMIEVFTQRRSDYFKAAPLGIHSVPGHFLRLEKELEKTLVEKTKDIVEAALTNQAEAAEGPLQRCFVSSAGGPA